MSRFDPPFKRSAASYDALYEALLAARKTSFVAEAQRVHGLIQSCSMGPGRCLLDVACGTGAFLPYLSEHYAVEGLDASSEMLAVARARNPGVRFHLADMADFRLESRFDAVICLGSSIGYVRTIDGLNRTVSTLAAHTVPGGVIVIHSWVTPDKWQAGRTKAELVDTPELKIARVTLSDRVDDVSIMDMHHLVAASSGVDYFVERHEMGLFTPEQYCAAFARAGLSVSAHPASEPERAFYIGVRLA